MGNVKKNKEEEIFYTKKLITFLEFVQARYRQREIEELKFVEEIITSIEAHLFRNAEWRYSRLKGQTVEQSFDWNFYERNFPQIKNFKEKILNLKLDPRLLNNSEKNWKKEEITFSDMKNHCRLVIEETEFLVIAVEVACDVLGIKIKKELFEKCAKYFISIKNRAEKLFLAMNLLEPDKDARQFAKELIFGTEERPYSMCSYLTPYLSFPNGSFWEIDTKKIIESIEK
jgi:hypothetical protein